jgi:hypothetical protein
MGGSHASRPLSWAEFDRLNRKPWSVGRRSGKSAVWATRGQAWKSRFRLKRASGGHGVTPLLRAILHHRMEHRGGEASVLKSGARAQWSEHTGGESVGTKQSRGLLVKRGWWHRSDNLQKGAVE